MHLATIQLPPTPRSGKSVTPCCRCSSRTPTADYKSAQLPGPETAQYIGTLLLAHVPVQEVHCHVPGLQLGSRILQHNPGQK